MFTWSEEYSTHIRAIDDDHKGLFEVFNILFEAHQKGKSHEQIGYAIEQLSNYVYFHFEREERFMAKAGYPGLDEHRAAHQKITSKIQGLRALYHETPEKVKIEKVVHFLTAWLQEHIIHSDMQCAPYLRGEISGDEIHHAETGFINVTAKVPSDKAELIENFIDVVLEYGLTQDIERLIKQKRAEKIAEATELFT